MTKKIALLSLLVAFLGLVSISVSDASMVPPTPNSESFIVEQYIHQGWNILAGTLIPRGIQSGSEIVAEDISAMWYFSPRQGKYLQVLPTFDQDGFYNEDDDEVLTHAMWFYSKRAGTIKYSTLEDYPPLKNRKFYKGWNFVSITPEFKNKKVKEFQGACNIQKIAGYQNGSWSILTPENLSKNEHPDTKNLAWGDLVVADSEQDIGSGLLMKMADNCNMALKNTTTNIPPPQLPQ